MSRVVVEVGLFQAVAVSCLRSADIVVGEWISSRCKEVEVK